jgi:glyoxylase-like metal-dependent hydrolase (beta-lactamase superfamily II)
MRLARIAALVGVLAGAGVVAGSVNIVAQQAASEIRVLPVRGNVYMLVGGGPNVIASVGKDGVLLVDAGPAAMGERMLAAVRDLSRRVTAAPAPLQACIGGRPCSWWGSSEMLPTAAATRAPRPIAGIINTSGNPDHIGANAVLSAAGRSYGVRNLNNTVPGAFIVAHENVTLRLGRAGQSEGLATETYFGREKKLNFFNGEAVIITHQPAAHSDGDSMVYFRGSEVLATGDILDMTSYPVIDVERGGTIEGVVDALNWILDVAVVEHMMEGGTMILPGHGRVADAADVAYYRDMMTIMRDRVTAMRAKGMTLDQIKAARPTRDYDGRWGRNPAWTPAQLVEAIYRTLPPRT